MKWAQGVLNRRLTAHWVSDHELVALSLRDGETFRLDPGERHLWAYALGRSDAWVASSADRAAINAAVRLRWEDRLVSLEELANHAGARSALETPERTIWFGPPVRLAQPRPCSIEVSHDRFSVLESVRYLIKQYRSFIKSSCRLADPKLWEQFERHVNEADILVKGPYVTLS